MNRNVAYKAPHTVSEEIYDEVELPEYEISRTQQAKRRNVTSAKEAAVTSIPARNEEPAAGTKKSKLSKSLVILAFVAGITILVLLLIVVVLAIVQSVTLSGVQVGCSEPPQIGNGTVTVTGGSFTSRNGLGSVAEYSCNAGYELVGDARRHCLLAIGGTLNTGYWNGSTPSCQVSCENLHHIENGRVDVSPTSNGQLANYKCDRGFVLEGSSSRECVYSSGGEQGEWRGSQPSCANGILIDCEKVDCRLSPVTCLDHQGHCRISCNDTSPYACHRASIECPSSGGGCTVDCASDYDYACLDTSTQCPQNGDCSLLCADDYSCQYSNVTCPTNGQCHINCEGIATCRYANFSCNNGENQCGIKCSGSSSCQYITSLTANSITCSGPSSCSYTTLTGSGEIICSGPSSCRSYSNQQIQAGSIICSGYSSCYDRNIECQGSGGCLSCEGQYSCRSSTITFPDIYQADLRCANESACSSSTIICPPNRECTINCSARSACNSARVTCPTGNYNCNIYCTDPFSCQSLSITSSNANYVNLQCCGSQSCTGSLSGVVPASFSRCSYATY